MLIGNVLITGGTGTIGHAIIDEALANEWPARFTIFSRDPVKQILMRDRFRNRADLSFIIGDVVDYDAVEKAMAGRDVVIHAAAMKHIPEGEYFPSAMYEVNVVGSRNVAQAALRQQVGIVVGITTDKACYPVNAYGCTKKMMEHIWMEFADIDSDYTFALPRYGNVLESTGSVLTFWKGLVEDGEPLKVTHPSMSRFWLSPRQAVHHILEAIDQPSGYITVPLMKGCEIVEMIEFLWPGYKPGYEIVGMRAGEKIHEVLVTAEEWGRDTGDVADYAVLRPSTMGGDEVEWEPYRSDTHLMTKGEFLALAKEVGFDG